MGWLAAVLDPEESLGRLWHGFANSVDAPATFPEAAVSLADLMPRLAVLFRGLGGESTIEIRAAADTRSEHRLSWRRRIGTVAEAMQLASFDGEVLRLPSTLACLPDKADNAAAYRWLAAMAAQLPPPEFHANPLAHDLAALSSIHTACRKTLEIAPGLAPSYQRICQRYLQTRRCNESLPTAEAAVEQLLRYLLGAPASLFGLANEFRRVVCEEAPLANSLADANYQSFEPVPFWVCAAAPASGETPRGDDLAEIGSGRSATADGRTRRARRKTSGEAERRDSFILNPLQTMLRWTEFLNLNRHVDDDDEAPKGIDDQEEIALATIARKPRAMLAMDLDLAPSDLEREALSGENLYPEWDFRTRSYLPAYTRVLSSRGEAAPMSSAGKDDPRRVRRARAVRRQFEALRPAHQWHSGYLDGDELDMDAAVRSHVDQRATGECHDRLWRQLRPADRDLAVSILIDVSRSTESAVTGRAVIDIEREALASLAWGLDACGDDCAIHAFSSLRRDRVYLTECKAFGETMSDSVEARIAALRPGFYTRLGAAIRHSSHELVAQARKRRLLLVVTDGKPNDMDHYEGQYGIEDSRAAVMEARRAGHAVFGIIIDEHGRNWSPRIFGRGGYALITHPDRLTEVLPAIYRQLVMG